MKAEFYLEVLYPFQDQVLQIVNQAETGFYLSGGTGASRGFLEHRFSDDLDLFVNDDSSFGLWADRIVQALRAVDSWAVQVLQREQRFVRLMVERVQTQLKVEMINDVPSRVGEVTRHATLGRLDSAENILANKVTAALDREEPKDLVDIWGFWRLAGLSVADAIQHAEGKAAGVFPADLARVLSSISEADHQVIRWQRDPGFETLSHDLFSIAESLLLGV